MEKAKNAVPTGLKKWHEHYAKVKKANPKLAGKEVMQKAKESYKK